MPIDIVGREYEEFPEPKTLKNHGPARVISLCNQKGGVGKTTTTINIASALAQFGRKVLVVDFDPQGAASVGLGMNPYDLDLSIYNVLTDLDTETKSAIVPTKQDNLDLLPANIDLSAVEVQLVNEVARESILTTKLSEVSDDYDVILIDCQPSLGLLTVNALTASHGVLIPLSPEYFALRGVAMLTNTIKKVKQRLNQKLDIDGTIMTMVDKRTLHSHEIAERLYEAFGDKLMHTCISRTVKFADATVKAESILQFAPNHKGAVEYRNLAKELIAKEIVS